MQNAVRHTRSGQVELHVRALEPHFAAQEHDASAHDVSPQAHDEVSSAIGDSQSTDASAGVARAIDEERETPASAIDDATGR